MAKIKKREDGRYEKKITVGRNKDGSLNRKTVYAKTQKELDQKCAEILHQVSLGTLSADEHAVFGELAETWVEDFKPGISDKMRLRYKSVLHTQLAPLHKMKIKELKPMHLQQIINKMVDAGYAQKSMLTVKQTATQILDLAVQNDIVFRNVFAKVKVPHVEPAERLPITDEQRKLILATWQGHRMGLPTLLMLYCGLRRGEMLALLWSDIDLTAGTLSVNKAADMPTNASSVKKPKTKAGIRNVPIPDIIRPAVLQARANADSLYVCPAVQTGGMMSAQAYDMAWKSYMHYLNLCAGGRDKIRTKNKNGEVQFLPAVQAMESFTAHQLRHAYATTLYDAGVDVKTAQKLLGHSDFSVTMKIYTHLSSQKEQQGIENLNAFLNSQVGDVTRLRKTEE